ncbi:hypothetical protein Dsin_002449 [Dipteronia sinensis]|uniref:DUF659 domain-containing protein n=1 Tax=Dipteronia sinensis TaxID=43782 RepID=A0AAE0B737_9ROSI|nr:hypothetical protein Dsin_002449 [Dipteronia sinensis]
MATCAGTKTAKEKRKRWDNGSGDAFETFEGIDQLLSQNKVSLESFDRMDDYIDTVVSSDMDYLFTLLDGVIEEIDEKLVVQVVIDNASVYKAARKMLIERRKFLYWTLCATHCLDLMLEKLRDLPQHRNSLQKATKKVSNFIYNYGWVLELMRKFAKSDIVRPIAIRFSTAYLTLESLSAVKEALQRMFVSRQWNSCRWANKSDGKEVNKYNMDDRYFWPSVAYALKTTKPLVDVLRLVDSEKEPAMRFIYGAMDAEKEQIVKNLGGEESSYKEIWKIIDDYWDFQSL